MKRLTKWKQVQKLKVGQKVLLVPPPSELTVMEDTWQGGVRLTGDYEFDSEDWFLGDLKDGVLFYVLK